MASANSGSPSASNLLILDGGTGRELLRLGAPFRQPEWSALALMEAPEFVTRVHQGYIDAGADLVTTNSYAVVPFHIGAERFAREGASLAARAGRLARAAAAAAPRPVRVAGSLPPVCGSYRPDLFDAAVARPVLQRLVQALEPFVDVWLAETISGVAEMELMGEVLAGSPQPWWISYTLDDRPERAAGAHLRSGEPAAAAALRATERGAAAVLFNCSQPEVVGPGLLAAAQGLRSGHAQPLPRLGAYANAFAPQPADARANAGLSTLRPDLDPEQYLQWARQWQAAGATIIGGCCGVGPEHIAKIHQALRPHAPRGR